jgi:nicotinamide riboside transporter PnuC
VIDVLDLLGTMLILIGSFLIATKIHIRTGFVLGAIGSMLLGSYFYKTDQNNLVMLQVYFTVLNIYGWWRWKY